MQKVQTRRIVETGFLTAIIVVIAMLGATVPMLGFIGSIFVPVTVAVAGVRNGVRWSASAVIAAFLLLSFFIGPILALITMGTFGLLGISIGHGIVSGWRPAKLLLLPSVIVFASSVLQLFGGFYLMNIDYMRMWDDVKAQSMAQVVEVYAAQGYEGERLTAMADMMRWQMEYTGYALAVLLFAGAIFSTYLVCLFADKILARLNLMRVYMPSLDKWQMPSWTLYMFVSGALMIYWGHTREIEVLRYLGGNLSVLGVLMLTVEGLACLAALAVAFNLQVWMRWAMIIALLMFMPITIPVFGAMDLLINYREKLRGNR